MSAPPRETRIIQAFVKLTDTLIDNFDVVDLLHTLVEECIGLVETDAGGLILADPFGELQLVASSSQQADVVEIMQLTAGAGPSVDCYETGTAVAVDDIDKSGSQWPAFRAVALEQGFSSMHVTPLRLRGNVIGTINLLNKSVVQLSPRDAAVVQAFADVATISILQERLVRESGIVAEQLQRALESRVLIEQAKGVISEVGSMDMDEAFQTLRRYARSNNLPLRQVAEGVTTRTLDILTSDHGPNS